MKSHRVSDYKRPVPERLEFSGRIENDIENLGNSIRGYIESDHECKSFSFDFDSLIANVELVTGPSFSVNFAELGLDKKNYLAIVTRKGFCCYSLLFVPSKTSRLIFL